MNKSIIRIIGYIITILSILFVVVAIFKLGFDFSSVENVPIFICVILRYGFVIALLMYCMAFAWKCWLDFFSKRTNSIKEVVCVYTKANIGKYLPGNVMHYVERNLYAGKLGIEQKRIVACSVIEIIGQVFVAMAFGTLFSFAQLKEVVKQLLIYNENKKILVLIGIIMLLVMIGILIGYRKKILEIVHEYINVKFFKTILKTFSIYMIVLLTSGIVMVMVYKYVGGSLTIEKIMVIISSYIIAWVLGFVVPGAPGGIGVREFVLVILLSSVLGQEMTLTVSIIHRLITIIGDFMAYLFRFLILKKDGNL